MTWSNKVPRQMLFFVTGISVLLILLGATTAQSTTYYVSLSGNDSNSGTSTSSPFKTFAKAVKPLRPGDTLYIRGGTWTQQLDLQTPNINGTSSAYIKIAGYPGETVTIRYADSVEASYGPIKARGARGYLTFENLVLDGINNSKRTGWLIGEGNHNFILRNLEIKNFKSNALKIAANNIQIINCKLHHAMPASTIIGQGAYYYGIYLVSGSSVLIQGNEIYSNSGGGLHAYPGPISGLIVRNNSIHDNNTTGKGVFGGLLLQGSSGKVIQNTLLYNNLVYKNTVYGSGILISSYTNGTKLLNNTVYGNKAYGVHVGYNSTTTNTIVQNNIIYGNSGGNYINKSANTTYASNVTTDPKFISTSSNNFQLQSSSPAVNTGVRLSTVTTDYRNLPRPKGSSHDIGGYENY